jgi:hypothetical protein
MTTPSQPVEAARRSLLDQIAGITTMQPGTLAEEWREHPDPSGQGTVRTGPYFKHQLWKDGRNISRRVPAEEALLLREDIDNAKHFAQLTGDLARLNIEHTRTLRTSPSHADAHATDGESKKNSARKQAAKSLPKPKPSSRKPKRP